MHEHGDDDAANERGRRRLPPGVVATLPLVVPTTALGLLFGLLAKPVMGSVAPVVMSCVVFAGGAQFAALSVMAASGGMPASVLAGVMTNLRFLPTGFAIASWLRGGRARRVLEGQMVVDASFVLAARGDGSFERTVLLWSTATQFVCWTGGTLAGVLTAGTMVDPHALGLDAAFPAFFLTLLAGELRQHGREAVGVVALAALLAAAMTPLLPPGAPILAAATACLLGLRHRRRT